MKRVALGNPPDTQPRAFKRAVLQDCLPGIFRTGRIKPATRRRQRGNEALVKPDHCRKCAANRARMRILCGRTAIASVPAGGCVTYVHTVSSWQFQSTQLSGNHPQHCLHIGMNAPERRPQGLVGLAVPDENDICARPLGQGRHKLRLKQPERFPQQPAQPVAPHSPANMSLSYHETGTYCRWPFVWGAPVIPDGYLSAACRPALRKNPLKVLAPSQPYPAS